MTTHPVQSSPLPPEAIGDYRIVSALSNTALRALGPGDKQVVLKIIPPDCLQRGNLHPNIHARLSRVRELAHPGVANLHSVERDKPFVFAVWDDVDGLPIDRYVQMHDTSPMALGRLAREVILVVESLHALGIVHGRIHPNNVLIDSRGNVRLTHISPLLYDDPELDNAATMELIGRLVHVGRQTDSAFGRSVQDAINHKLPLRTLATRLSVSVDSPSMGRQTPAPDSDSGIRLSTIALALALAVAGVAIAYVITRLSGSK